MNEWENEPDRLEFEYEGFKCVIQRHDAMKHLCGYVGLPKWHPYYGKEYGLLEDRIVVHGGLTFSETGNEKGLPKGYWWIGFDCAHFNDFVPGMKVISQSKVAYRSMEYVKGEIKRLVRQLTPSAIAARELENG